MTLPTSPRAATEQAIAEAFKRMAPDDYKPMPDRPVPMEKMMAKRNPRMNPARGDRIEYVISNGMTNTFRVECVEEGIVYYWDEGIIDHVPTERWRKWFVGKRGVTVTPAKEAGNA